MNKMKKITAIILAACLMLTLFSISAAAQVRENPNNVQFKEDGTFKIMQVSDIQDGAFVFPITRDFIKECLVKYSPDLVVLTGDNIAGYRCGIQFRPVDRFLVKSAITTVMEIFEEMSIPVVAVFGNHDDQTTLISKEEQMKIYESFDCFLGIDEGEDISGCGTYNLPILSSDGKKTAYNLWLFDSGTYDEENGGYDRVRQDQIDWYRQKADELKAQNGGVSVPSMSFQHIIVPEIYDALKEVPEGTEGAVERSGKWYTFDEANTYDGSILGEGPCPGTVNENQFSAMQEQGDVVAMFFGHDHVNAFRVKHEGIDLVATPGAGFCSYGDDNRGIRMIYLDEKDTSGYETEVVTFFDIYGDDLEANLHFVMFGSEFGTWERIGCGIGYFCVKFAKLVAGIFMA